MFMQNFDDVFGDIKDLTRRKDDDWAGKLNHFYTVLVLGACALAVSMTSYVGDKKIECWTPAHFSDTWDEYANDYCWVRNTYRVAWEDNLPYPDPKREYVVYYQWIPFYLLGQALLFFIPAFMWRAMNSRSGLDLDFLGKNASTYMNTDISESGDGNAKEQFLDDMVTSKIKRFLQHLKRVDHSQKNACATSCLDCLFNFVVKFGFSCGRGYSSHLITLYIIIKFLMLANVIGQMFLLTVFLGSGYLYGFNAIGEFIDGTLQESVRFPRVTFCDLEIRRLGNVHRYTIQCVLPINLFHEMIFLIIWFWFLAVAFLTACNLIGWIIKVTNGDRMSFIEKQLSCIKNDRKHDYHNDPEVTRFVRKYLRQDGVFILRLIYENTGILTSSEVVVALWEDFTDTRVKNLEARQKEEDELLKERQKLRRASSVGIGTLPRNRSASSDRPPTIAE